MEVQEDATERIIEFYRKDGEEKILEGKVWVQGTRLEIPGKRITSLRESLYFDPPLTTAREYRQGCMKTLIRYLLNHQPLDKRGLIFFPSAEFSLFVGSSHLSLYMQEEKEFGQGEAIDVFDKKRLNRIEFEEMIKLFEENRASSFVLGALRERIDKNRYTLLRRYFLE